MSYLMENFHFLRPAWLLLLIPALLLLFRLWQMRAIDNSWHNLIDRPLLDALLIPGSQSNRKPLLFGLLLAWLIGTLALAGPTWKRIETPVEKNSDPLVIVLDLSRSMYANDLKPSRLIRAQRKLMDILNLRKEGLTGLVAYAGDAHTVVPLTDDTATISNMVRALSPDIMPTFGANPESGVKLASQLLKRGAAGAGTILLITDKVPPKQISPIIKHLGNQQTLNVLGVGTAQGSPIPLANGLMKNGDGAIIIAHLQAETLRKLAQQAGGHYATMTLTDDDLSQVLPSRKMPQQLSKTERHFDQWLDMGRWLVLLLLPLALLAFRRGGIIAITAVCLLPILPQPAHAISWDELWLNPNQQGEKLLEQNDPQGAAKIFTSPEWQAKAQVESGQLNAAAKTLEPVESAEAQYNRGNTLVRQGEYQQALDAYKKALQLNPELKQAKDNADRVKAFLKKKNQAKQKGQQKNSPNNSGKQSPQNSSASGASASDKQNSHEPKQAKNGNNKNQKPESSSSSTEGGANSKPNHREQPSQAHQQSSASGDDQQGQTEQQRPYPQPEQDSAQQAQATEQNSRQKANSHQQAGESDNQATDTANPQALNNWLKQIPDNPGELLRRKFLQEKQQRERQQHRGGW